MADGPDGPDGRALERWEQSGSMREEQAKAQVKAAPGVSMPFS